MEGEAREEGLGSETKLERMLSGGALEPGIEAWDIPTMVSTRMRERLEKPGAIFRASASAMINSQPVNSIIAKPANY